VFVDGFTARIAILKAELEATLEKFDDIVSVG
jgi:hypothetical protein